METEQCENTKTYLRTHTQYHRGDEDVVINNMYFINGQLYMSVSASGIDMQCT